MEPKILFNSHVLGLLWKINFYVVANVNQTYQCEFIIITKNWKQSNTKRKMALSVTPLKKKK